MPEEKDDSTISDADTRSLIYEHLKDAPERQLVDSNDLDTKAATLFGAASVVMALASFGNLGAGTTGRIAGAVITLLIGAALAYVVTAVAALLQLRPMDFRRSSYALTLQQDFRNRPAAELQEWIIRQARRAWEFNAKVSERKAQALEWIVRGLAAEVFLVVAALVVSRF